MIHAEIYRATIHRGVDGVAADVARGKHIAGARRAIC
jgi:hypothetical protein